MGIKSIFYYAGLNSIHPTFVQEMMSDPGFDTEDIIYNLKNLSSVGGRKFSKELISLGKIIIVELIGGLGACQFVKIETS